MTKIAFVFLPMSEFQVVPTVSSGNSLPLKKVWTKPELAVISLALATLHSFTFGSDGGATSLSHT